MTFVLDTPEEIAFFRLISIRGACKLHMLGMRHSAWGGRSPVALAKRTYAIKGNAASVVAQLDLMIERQQQIRQQRSAIMAARPQG